MSGLRLAVLDLYAGEQNYELQDLRTMLSDHKQIGAIEIFDVRKEQRFPSLDSFDVFIASGGPGDPTDTAEVWVDMFYQWLDGIFTWNQQHRDQKSLLLICHSFQMACLHFGLAEITLRKSPSFGVYPVHLTDAGVEEELFAGLDNPFYAADFRSFQAVNPREERLEELSAEILALEKVRPHVPLDRAIMGIRFTDAILGLQFHPEVAPRSMRRYLKDAKRREVIVREQGEEKYNKMLRYLNDTSLMHPTYRKLLGNFVKRASGRKAANGH